MIERRLHRARDAATVARTLQAGLAPPVVPHVPGLRLHTRYQSSGMGEVGGDWYDVLKLPDDSIAVVIGDVAGRGISAATTMAQLCHAARAYLFEDTSPGSVLTRLSALAEWALPGEVATALVAVLPSGEDRAVIASAGHLPPLLLHDGAAVHLAPPRGPALGIAAAARAEETFHFPPGSALVLYTDGLVERRGEGIDEGLQRLAHVALEATGDDAICDLLMASLPDQPSDDDLALVMVRREQEI